MLHFVFIETNQVQSSNLNSGFMTRVNHPVVSNVSVFAGKSPIVSRYQRPGVRTDIYLWRENWIRALRLLTCAVVVIM